LNALASSKVKDVLAVPGGHVGAVVGSKAEKTLYPKITEWIRRNSCDSKN
jgi:poly-beta-hydroxyalkanoate depolymerase